MTEIAAEPWPEPPLAGTEAAAVLGALERRRATLAWKCSGLDAAGLRATLGTSAITLGGLLKHLAHVEDRHFARLWCGTPVGEGGLDQLGAYTTRSGERPNLRRVLLDLVEEYARHAGHADLIRESVDGLTGEDPPRWTW
ncbi:DUF664 domain-containing protein [Streptomyces sp. NPDC085460]|uniref:mycothiol transferase n=1 Tax=Streptomyces sp. NPDC085460 TaxID=3365723 RepID=UPI0037D149E9